MVGQRGSIPPTTDINVFAKQWKTRIIAACARHGMQAQADDLFQEIILKIIEQDGLNKFDSTKGAFSTYCYALIFATIRSARTKSWRDKSRNPVSVEALQARKGPDGDQSAAWQRLEAKFSEDKGINSEFSADFRMQLDRIMEVLRSKSVRSFFFNGEGACVTRDFETLFRMILDGADRKEIQEHFNYSPGSVGIMFEELRRVPEVAELMQLYKGNLPALEEEAA